MREKICQLITRVKSLIPRDIRGTLPTAYEQKKNIITVRIDNGHTPSIAAVGRDDGTVEGHQKGTAKGPNAIRRDNEELGRDVGSIKVWDDETIEGQYDRSSLKNQQVESDSEV